MAKENIGKPKWEDFLADLQEKVMKIAVPADLGAEDIIRIHSEIDMVFSEVRVHFAQVKYQYENMKRKLSNAQKSVILLVKNLPKDDQPKNDKERDAWVTDFLSKNPIDGMKIDIFTAMDIMTERYESMLALVEILKEKTDRLSTMYGCIKLDAEIGMGKASRGSENYLNSQIHKTQEANEYM